MDPQMVPQHISCSGFVLISWAAVQLTAATLQYDIVEPQGLPWDRVAKVKPFWESVPQQERLDLLSIPLNELKQRAAEMGANQRKKQGGQAVSFHFVPDLGISTLH